MDFIRSLEQSGLAAWVRESGTLWSYPTILFAHTLGLATLAGVNAGIDLRILGFAPHMPLAPLTRRIPSFLRRNDRRRMATAITVPTVGT